jgi:hypothetical protein
VCVILLFYWTLGIYIMWLRAHFTMTLRKRHPDNVSGANRAILELAVAMQDELDIHDLHPSLLREEELKDRVDKELKGGAISYAYPKADLQTYSIRKGLKGWFKREKWWFSAIFLTTLMCATVWTPFTTGSFWFMFWCLGLWLGQIFAFSISTTNGSRILIILCWCIVSSIVIIICSATIPLWDSGYY